MWHSHFPCFSFPRHITGPKVWVSHFPCYLRFLAIFQFLQCVFSFSRFSFSSFVSFLKLFQVLSVCVSFSTVFSVSSHIPGPAVCVCVRVCVCVCVCVCVSMFFQFSCHMPGPTVYIFHVFQFFSPYSISYHVSFSISSFVSFLAILQVLQCVSHFHVSSVL